MPIPTPVNGQITDAVTQANYSDSSSLIEGADIELMGEVIRALGAASQKGVSKQAQAVMLSLAASAAGVNLIYPFDTEGETISQDEIAAYLAELIEKGL